LPYKDPAKRLWHAKTRRKHYYKTSMMEETLRYYVVRRHLWVEIVDETLPDDKIVSGPTTLIAATDAYIAAGGLAQDFGD